MNAQQTTMVVRYLHAVCPQQAIDEYTADAWHDVIGDLRFEDCKEAVRNLAREKSFIDTKDIRIEVRRLRTRRIDEYGEIEMESDLDPIQFKRRLLAKRKAIADGNPPPPPAALPQRDMAGIAAVSAALRDRHTQTDTTEGQAS